MTELIIDTGAEEAFIALKKSEILAYKSLGKAFRSSEKLGQSVYELLKEHEIKPSNLSQISVGCGPGSYTGTRAGVAFATALSCAAKVSLYSFYSPLAHLPIKEGAFSYAIDAKGGLMFAIIGCIENGGIIINKILCEHPIEDLPHLLITPHPHIFPERAHLLPHPNLSHTLPLEPCTIALAHYLRTPT